MPGKKIKILKYNKRLLNNIDYIFSEHGTLRKEIFNKEKKLIKKWWKIYHSYTNPKNY